MTPGLRRVMISLLALVGSSAAAAQADPLAPLPQDRSPAARRIPRPSIQQGPSALNAQLAALGRSFDGKAGIAVVSLKDGWEVGYGATALYPQQSCSKLWVAITAMDAVDKGRVSLTDKVTLDRGDLTLFHQPLAAKILGGGHTTTLGALLFTAITESDNTANDKLMRSIGGPDAVRAMIAAKGLGARRL